MHALALIAIVVQTCGPSTSGRSAVAARTAAAVPSSSATAVTSGRRLRLLVRIDSHQEIEGLRVADLAANITAIWRPYAEIAFAGIGAAAPAPFDDELRLVITERAPQPAAGVGAVLGWIEFVDGRPRNTVTVSVSAARTLMNRSKWLGRPFDALPAPLRQRFLTRALSRSAAHEIGHYLLRSRAHAARGLMRELMTSEEIMDDAPALHRLLPDEIAALDQRLAGALAEAPPPDPPGANPPMPDREL